MSLWYRVISIVLPLGILMGGIFTLIILSKDPARFPLHAIEIKGDVKHLNSAFVQELVSQHMKKGFFWLNVKEVQKSIASLPFVASVEVKRVWPDKVSISVVEKIPQGIWNEVGILGSKGEIFYPDMKEIATSLPRFNGPESRASEMLQQYFAFLELLSPLALSVSEINIAPDGTWKISLDNGIAIILGKTALNERLNRFVLVYPSSIMERKNQITYLDLRYTNGLAIGWK